MCTTKPGSSKSAQPNEPRFIPSQTRRSLFNSRFFTKLRYYGRLPFSSPIGLFLTAYCTAIAITNIGTYLWKGPGHPLNRFHWDRMKARGELSPELLEKERLLGAYIKDVYQREPNPPTPM